LNLRLRPTLKAKLEKLAKEDRRTLSAYVENLLEDHVEDAFHVSIEREQKAKQRRTV
jgi:predicted DNA-binding protein